MSWKRAADISIGCFLGTAIVSSIVHLKIFPEHLKEITEKNKEIVEVAERSCMIGYAMGYTEKPENDPVEQVSKKCKY